jgi:hypothetical protein
MSFTDFVHLNLDRGTRALHETLECTLGMRASPEPCAKGGRRNFFGEGLSRLRCGFSRECGSSGGTLDYWDRPGSGPRRWLATSHVKYFHRLAQSGV